MKELMFDVIPLSRFNHMVGNGDLKVWSKLTAQTVVPWKVRMSCPMNGRQMPVCYCPIEVCSEREDVCGTLDDLSCIVCNHKKDRVPCQYMTDREADMKQHISKVHEPMLKAIVASNLYMKENTWLDLTSSWSIKDIEKRFKTFPETHIGLITIPIVCVIMDLHAEDPKSKNNASRVPVYSSLEWKKYINYQGHVEQRCNQQ